MDLKSLIAKMDAIEQSAILEAGELNPQQQAQNVLQPGTNAPAGGAPTTFTPTHFHKGNLGNKLPLMLGADGKFYWETNGAIQPWQGNTENRSGWNPASVDGIIDAAGKYIDFDEGDTWKTFKSRMDQLDTDALMQKLKDLLGLVDQYAKLKAAKDQKKANPAEKRTTAQLAANNDLKQSGAMEGKVSIADSLVESFGYTTEAAGATAGQQAAAAAGGFGAAKLAGKALGKAIPGVGLAFGAADAYDRAKKGDYVGAGMAGASGLASLIPGIGTAAALGLDAANIARDYKSGEFGGAGASTTPVTGADPKVLALQKKLIAAGAKIAADGKMGPMTQAAMKQFPNIKEGGEMKSQQSVAEGIASIRDRLAMIENQQETVTDEGVLSNIVQGAKNIGSAFRAGVADPAGAKALAGAATKTGEKAALKTGAAVAKNPVKTALGGAAVGGGLGLAAGGSGAGASTTPVQAPTKSKPASTDVSDQAAQAAQASQDAEAEAASDKELAELKAKIDALVGELSKSQNPEIQKGLADIKAKMGDGSTPAAAPTGAQAGAVAPNMAQVNK